MKRPILAFTLVELLVVIGIIALLLAVLLPSLAKARQQANIVKCQAQLRDYGNAIQMYTLAYKGWLPGPCLGQFRAGYSNLKQGDTGAPLGNFLWPYLKMPDPGNGTLLAKSLLCPGYLANNPGTAAAETDSWTYQLWEYDPFPIWGYPSLKGKTGALIFPKWAARNKINTGAYTGPTTQMKLSQIWLPAEIGIIGDADKSLFLFDEHYLQADLAMNSTPSHGGRAESGVGMGSKLGGDWDGCSPNYKFLNNGTATNPPRNYLYADGHVATVRVSGPPIWPEMQSRLSTAEKTTPP